MYNKGLKAFERIIETFYDKESEDIQIVRKELQALEIIKEIIEIFPETSRKMLRKVSKEKQDLLKDVLL